MMELHSLSWLERWALRILVRSSNTSLVVVKEHFNPDVFVAADPRDPVAVYVTRGQDEPEPASMQLERLFHLPAYGEDE
jgi:hypothetical protein